MRVLRGAFDALPVARWGALFHVFRLEQPEVTLEWQPMAFPKAGRSLLDGVDVGLFVAPPREDGLSALTIETSAMAVLVAAGHRLALHDHLSVADILDERFLGGANVHPEWRAFWHLDERRGGPANLLNDDVHNAEQGLEIVAAGKAIATVPASMADGLPHPGVVALPLRDGPLVHTRLVWRSGDENPIIDALVGLAEAWTRKGRGDQANS
jgi:DNA-binding transcriptional LysR family regulator